MRLIFSIAILMIGVTQGVALAQSPEEILRQAQITVGVDVEQDGIDHFKVIALTRGPDGAVRTWDETHWAKGGRILTVNRIDAPATFPENSRVKEEVKRGCNGDVCWDILNGGRPTRLEGEAAENLRALRLLDTLQLSAIRGPFSSVHYHSTGELEGTPVHVIEAWLPGDQSVLLFSIETETHRPLRIQQFVTDYALLSDGREGLDADKARRSAAARAAGVPGGYVVDERQFWNYRTVEGIDVPLANIWRAEDMQPDNDDGTRAAGAFIFAPLIGAMTSPVEIFSLSINGQPEAGVFDVPPGL